MKDTIMTTNDSATAAPPDPLFASLRAELGKHDTPADVQRHLLAAFARQHGQASAPRWWQRLGATGWALAGCGASGLAALALLLALLLVMLRPPASVEVAGADSDAPFIALDAFDGVDGAPAVTVLTTSVPRASLGALGVAVNPDNAGDMVKAEILVGADGSALALRLAP